MTALYFVVWNIAMHVLRLVTEYMGFVEKHKLTLALFCLNENNLVANFGSAELT